MAAVREVLLCLQPASTWNLGSVFPVQLSVPYFVVESRKCWPSSWRQALYLLKIFHCTWQSSCLYRVKIYPSVLSFSYFKECGLFWWIPSFVAPQINRILSGFKVWMQSRWVQQNQPKDPPWLHSCLSSRLTSWSMLPTFCVPNPPPSLGYNRSSWIWVNTFSLGRHIFWGGHLRLKIACIQVNAVIRVANWGK